MSKKKKGQAEFVKWFGPVLDALRALGGSSKPREISEWIGRQLKLSEEILNERYPKSGQLKFHNQIAWARQYLIWEKLLESSKRGVWTLTTKGWTTKITENQAYEIFLKWVKTFQEIRENKDSTIVEKEVEKVIEVQEIIEPEETQAIINPTLIEILRSLSPTGFERICGRLLKEHGFENIEITQRTRDGGIDGFADMKLNPFVSLSVFFECKKYKGTVEIEKVRAFVGALETHQKRRVEKGLFITTGSFSNEAWRIKDSSTKLELIDSDKLIEMFEEVELGVTAKTVYEPDLTFFEQYIDKTKHTS